MAAYPITSFLLITAGMQAPGAIYGAVTAQTGTTPKQQCNQYNALQQKLKTLSDEVAGVYAAKTLSKEARQSFQEIIDSTNDMKGDLEDHKKRWMISTAIMVITLIAVTAALIIYIMSRRSNQRSTISDIQDQLHSLEGGHGG